MARNSFGTLFRITTFGESRSNGLGVIIDGCPSGINITVDDINTELKRRMPKYSFETPRIEPDTCEILSGVFEGKSLGTPIALLTYNSETSTKDYTSLKNKYRPGHADYGWTQKFGIRDVRGGGRSSGRETLARVSAGAVAKKILASVGIKICAYPIEIAGIECNSKDEISDSIIAKLEDIKIAGDSAGGIIRCEITGVPAGIGEPVFEKLDAVLAHAIISIGAVKGIEFGSGFEFARLQGSTANNIHQNHNGGIIGGISDGNTIQFTAVIKAPPSIAVEQECKTSDGQISKISIYGRHDTCIVRRIIPVIEAMSAIALTDLFLQSKTSRVDSILG